MSSFDRSLAFGQLGESHISKWLQGRGHSIFPAYQIEQQTGKGPQLFSADGNLVLPDLLAFRDGAAQWFEAKHKTCFTWHRITQRWVTGIDIRHYEEYQQVAERTDLPVWLMFYHPKAEPSENDKSHGCPPRCPVGLFANELSILKKCENHRSNKHGHSGMVYWAHSSLRLVGAA